MFQGLFRALLVITVVACNAPPTPPNLSKGRSNGASAETADAFSGDVSPDGPIEKATETYKFKSITQDAYDYTFASGIITSSNPQAGALSLKRFAYVSDAKSLTDAEREIVSKLCRDIAVQSEIGGPTSSSSSSSSPSLADEKDLPVHSLQWRSYQSAASRTGLEKLMTAGRDVFCVANISNAAGTSSASIILDPVPSNKKTARGSAQLPKALETGIMLVNEDPSLKLKQENLIEVTIDAEMKLGIAALKSSDVTTAPSLVVKTSDCLLDASKSPAIVMNPTLVQPLDLTISSALEIDVKGITPRSIGGQTLKNCVDVRIVADGMNLKSEVSCAVYNAIKNEGLEAGCAWSVEIANSKDSENSLLLTLPMAKVGYRNFDIKKVDDALSAIPKSPMNPVTAKSIQLVGFAPITEAALATMFDLWIATEPVSFSADFDGYMKKVILEECDKGILGHAPIGRPELTMCPSAGLTEAAITKANDPYRPVIQLITASHETRHAVKWDHDFAKPAYIPCEGTAHSAVTMFALVSTCQTDFCIVTRKMATREYINELNYSIGDKDGRRFEGQCKIWSDAMNLTSANF